MLREQTLRVNNIKVTSDRKDEVLQQGKRARRIGKGPPSGFFQSFANDRANRQANIIKDDYPTFSG